jgi:protein-L-isoaspartate(D-aspartate) O-methyltransferase
MAVRRYEAECEEMLRIISARGVTDPRVLAAMRSVPRHLFVPEAFIGRSYDDTALPIGDGQTISQPYTVAFMTQALRLKEGETVLEIGTGSGYQAAVLAAMGVRVFTIERNHDLLVRARKVLEQQKCRVATRVGDGTVGWNEHAPYNGIIVTAAAPDIPEPLLKQLADGGHLVIPVGEMEMQSIVICTRRGEQFEKREERGFKFVPLIGKMGWNA